MNGITPMMEKMIRGLAYLKYATVSHILKLGISRSKDKSRKYFRELQKEGLVNRMVHVSVSEQAKKKGLLQRNREEYLWYLTHLGAKFLDAKTDLSLAEIRRPKKPKLELKNDYFHRVSSIFIHISFEKRVQEIGGTDSKMLLYYDQRKKSKLKNFDAETRLPLGE